MMGASSSASTCAANARAAASHAAAVWQDEANVTRVSSVRPPPLGPPDGAAPATAIGTATTSDGGTPAARASACRWMLLRMQALAATCWVYRTAWQYP